MTGTRADETRAMRCMPPKIMATVSADSKTPITVSGILNACSHASAMVLLCMALFANPKVMMMSMLKSIPIHLRWSPCLM